MTIIYLTAPDTTGAARRIAHRMAAINETNAERYRRLALRLGVAVVTIAAICAAIIWAVM